MEKIQIILEYIRANPEQIPAVVKEIEKLNVATKTTEEAGKKVTSGLFQQRMAYMELGHTARATMDLLILGGNNPRMLLAQLPQAIQGVTMLGVSFSTLLPILGGIAAAAGAGYLIWYQYSAAEREAAKAAANLKKEMTGVAEVFDMIQNRQKAGLMGPGTSKEFKDILRGSIPLYKNSNGDITRQSTEEVKTYEDMNIGDGMSVAVETGTKMVQLQKASALEVLKYLKETMEVQGKVDDAQITALDKIADLKKELHAEGATQLEQEKSAIRKKYEDERIEISKNVMAMGGTFKSPGQREQAENELLAISRANEAKEIRQKDFEQAQKDYQELDAIQKSINEKGIVRDKTTLDLEKKNLDDSLNNRLISVEDWTAKSLAVEDRRVANEKARLLVMFTFEKDQREKLLKLATDPNERKKLISEGVVAENTYQSQITAIDAKADGDRLKISQDGQREQRQISLQNISEIRSAQQEATAQYEESIKKIMSGQGRAGFLSVFKSIQTAEDDYIKKLKAENDALVKILNTIKLINAAKPGTFTEAEIASVKKMVSENSKTQIQSQKDTSATKLQIQTQELDATASLLGTAAEVAKKFGKEGFIAYKALAIAQAVVSGANAVLVQLGQGDAYSAPFRAAAAAAAAALQIAVIASTGYADGGIIQGPGTSRSDSVNIRASAGEYMFDAASVSKIGAERMSNIHQAIRQGDFAMAGSLISSPRTGARNFGPEKSSQNKPRIGRDGLSVRVGFVETRNQMRRFQRDEGAGILLDSMAERGNQVVR